MGEVAETVCSDFSVNLPWDYYIIRPWFLYSIKCEYLAQEKTSFETEVADRLCSIEHMIWKISQNSMAKSVLKSFLKPLSSQYFISLNLKPLENQRYFDIFSGYRNGTLT